MNCKNRPNTETKEGSKTEEKKAAIKPQQKRPESPAIKSITKYKTNLEDTVGAILKKEIYNKDGKCLEFIGYDYYGSGAETDRTKYEYDEAGNKVKSEKTDEGKTQTEKFTYYENGKLKTSSWSRGNKGASEEHFYNDKGDEIEIKYFTKDGKYDFSRVFEYEYDENNKLKSEKKWEKYTDGSADLMMYFMSYKYDDKGNKIEKLFHRENGNVYQKEVYKYDDYGNVLEEIEYEGEKISGKEINTYNEYGELIKTVQNSGNDIHNYTNTYRYDEYGHMVFMMYKHANGDAWGERVVYEY